MDGTSRTVCVILVSLLAVAAVSAAPTPVIESQFIFCQIPDVPDPECAACGGRNNNHSSDCPYYSGGGGYSSSDSESSGGGDLASAPIISFPTGIAGGVIGGGIWYFREMAGKYPKKNFLSSYDDFLTMKSDDPGLDKSWNAGMHIGGVPWLALFVPTWPIRQGIVGTAKWITKPDPPDPRIAVYQSIASNYAQLAQASQRAVDKASQDVSAAEWRQQQFLDTFINDHADLRGIREKDGIDAARESARKRLDAWSKSRDEKLKLAGQVSQQLQEKDAICRAAIEKASAQSFLADLSLFRKESLIDEQLAIAGLPEAVKGSLERNKKVTQILGNSKTGIEILLSLKELKDSRENAAGEGKEFGQWWSEEETTEKLLRINLKLLPVLAKKSSIGIAASAAESGIDGAYAIATSVAYHDQMEADRALLNKLQSANVFQDAAADDWKRLNIGVAAAAEREKAARARQASYQEMQKENQRYAFRLKD